MRRVVVLGGGPAGLAVANRLGRHRDAGADLEVLLVDRDGEHLFLPGLVAVMFGEAEPGALSRPLAELTHPSVRLMTGEATRLDPGASTVHGSFGTLPYDELIVALGADVGWPDHNPPCGELAPWTLSGALAGREALRNARPGMRVVVGPAGPAYRCPPAVFDLAARIARATGARVDLVHPWRIPLAPFGTEPSTAFTAMLAEYDVHYHGAFTIAHVTDDQISSDAGTILPYDLAFLVPPHRPPAVIAASPLAGPTGWPAVEYPAFTHPTHRNVTVIGDAAAPALHVGMAGTLAVFEAGHVADRIAAVTPSPHAPQMTAICFVDTGDVGSLLSCDFTGPAAGTGPARCVLMPPLRYFHHAKRLFAQEWFTGMVTGDAGSTWHPDRAARAAARAAQGTQPERPRPPAG